MSETLTQRASAFAVTIRGQGYLLSQQAHDIITELLSALTRAEQAREAAERKRRRGTVYAH